MSEGVLIWLRDEAFFVKAKEKVEIEKQLDKNYRSKQNVQPSASGHGQFSEKNEPG